MLQTYSYGDELVAPESIKPIDGMTFKGWDMLLAGTTTATKDMVINAVYDVKTFEVTFVNEDGSVIEKQQVEYGESAELPKTQPTSTGKVFMGWSTSEDSPWWDVKSDMTIGALFAHEKTVDSPVAELPEETGYVGPKGAVVKLTTSTKDAEIYYTTDGSEPVVPNAAAQIVDENNTTQLYDPEEGVTVKKPIKLRAMAIKSDMNDSCIGEVDVDITATNDISHAECAVADSPWFENEPVEPGVGVWFGDTLLEPGVDYDVSYIGNDAVGLATARVEGKGDYTGYQLLNFEIAEYDPNADVDPSVPADQPSNGDKPSGKQDNSGKQASSKTSGLAVGKKQVVGGATYKAASADAVEYTKAPAKASVTIPATVKVNGKSYKVTTIAANAFKGNKKLKKVTIGKNVTSIGQSAFQGCTALKSVVIPSKVAKIGKKAFCGCKKLKKVTFKTKKLTAKKVGAKAFKGTPKEATFKCGKKLKAYKKWLPKKGASKKAKFKK